MSTPASAEIGAIGTAGAGATVVSAQRGAIETAGASAETGATAMAFTSAERGAGVERSVPVLHIAWAELLLQSLAYAGVRDVVVSPGSRSTPLAMAADASTALRAHFIVDERTAGFFALGQARVTGRPTALVCTSGTACAHYFPALIEASMSGVPMIVLTADRPWELQQAGASQTIDQIRLFGSFVRMFAALGAPEPSDAALRAVARTAAQAVARSLGPEPGPVHVNVPFRKPLEPGATPGRGTAARPVREPWMDTWHALMTSGPTRSGGASSRKGLVSKAIGMPGSLDSEVIEEIARIVAGAERGLIVCGPAPAHGDVDALRREVGALAVASDFAIFAEATSQARFGLAAEEGGPKVVSAFDAMLRSAAFRRRFVPDVIVELGAPPVSAGYAQLLASAGSSCRRIVVTPLGWTDPMSSASFVVNASALTFCRALRARLPGVSGARGSGVSGARAADISAARLPGDWGARAAGVSGARAAGDSGADLTSASSFSGFSWAGALAAADARARGLIEQALSTTVLTEGAIARAVIDSCPPGSVLVLGNSSPVRDSDTYSCASSKSLCVLHQRGAAGIDGLVSGAVGAHSVSEKSVTLLLGDLSLVHDIGGLALTRALPGVGAAERASASPAEHVSVGVIENVSAAGENCQSEAAKNCQFGHAEQVSGGAEERQSGGSRALVIVVVNNGGGRIFEQLPIGAALGPGETFERCFATPQNVDFQAAAKAFGVAFERVTTLPALESVLARAHGHKRLPGEARALLGGSEQGLSPGAAVGGDPGHTAILVEAVVPPHDGAERIQALWASIDKLFQD